MGAVKGDTKNSDDGSCIKGSIYYQGGLGGVIIRVRGLVLTPPVMGIKPAQSLSLLCQHPKFVTMTFVFIIILYVSVCS